MRKRTAGAAGLSPILTPPKRQKKKTKRPQKNNKGVRRFLKEDVLIIDKIYDLVKIKGYKLDGAKLALAGKNYQVSDVHHYIRDLEKLKEIRKELISIKRKLTEIKDQL